MDGELEEKEVLLDFYSTRETAAHAALANRYKNVEDLTLPRELGLCEQVMMAAAVLLFSLLVTWWSYTGVMWSLTQALLPSVAFS